MPAAAVIFVQQPLQELDNFSKTVMSDNNAMATTYACLLLMPEGIVARCVWTPGYLLFHNIVHKLQSDNISEDNNKHYNIIMEAMALNTDTLVTKCLVYTILGKIHC